VLFELNTGRAGYTNKFAYIKYILFLLSQPLLFFLAILARNFSFEKMSGFEQLLT
jgi:hypothetical protein